MPSLLVLELPSSIQTEQDIPAQLRRVGQWCNRQVVGRSHIEWIAGAQHLWIVQNDEEPKDTSGRDPNAESASYPNAQIPQNAPVAGGVFQLFEITNDTPWRKLRNINDFWVDETAPSHRLFFATAEEVALAIETDDGAKNLAEEIQTITGGRAVLRTDAVSEKLREQNLPRTDTVNGAQAVAWLNDQIARYKASDVSLIEICFVLHTFIPAKVAAWSYFDRGSRIVRIDTLWGLPDGLQFLPHDSFQVDIKTKRILSEKTRFKPHYLKETIDGKWRYLPVRTDLARHRSIRLSDLVFVAVQTAKIAERLTDTSVAQVMWFCDVPAFMNVGRNLPWYRERKHTSDLGDIRPSRPLLPTITLRRVADVDRFQLREPPKAAILRLEPEPEVIRSEEFIERVASLAKSRNCPVELSGSVLCHAYYQLKSAGVVVYSEEPYAAHYRQRGRKVFEKLVRDKIPEAISSKGESVIDARLENREVRNALIGKLFEEAEEFLLATARDAKVEELADLLEIVRALATNQGSTLEEVLKKADEKRSRRGGFEGGIVLMETAVHLPSRMSGDPQRTMARRLQDLIRARRKAGGFVVPLLALIDVVRAGGVTIPLNRKTGSVRLRLQAGTLDIEEIEAPPALAEQLSLPVELQQKEGAGSRKRPSSRQKNS